MTYVIADSTNNFYLRDKWEHSDGTQSYDLCPKQIGAKVFERYLDATLYRKQLTNPFDWNIVVYSKEA